MILHRCKSRTYHEIDGTINNLGDLRHVARKNRRLTGRRLKAQSQAKGFPSLYGKVGKPEGGRMTHVVAVIGIAHPVGRRVDLYHAPQGSCVVWCILTACLFQSSALSIGESMHRC
jgi:hypothetical protein